MELNNILTHIAATTNQTIGIKQWFAKRQFDEIKQMLDTAYRAVVERLSGTMQPTETIDKVARWIANEPLSNKKWMVLFGGYGLGKSTMLLALEQILPFFHSENLRLIKDEQERVAKWGGEPEIEKCLFHKPCRVLANEVNGGNVVDLAKEWVVMIDELGREPTEQMVKSGNITYRDRSNPIQDLLARRYDRRAITIIATNMQDLIEDKNIYGAFVSDRMREVSSGVKFTGKSFRGN